MLLKRVVKNDNTFYGYRFECPGCKWPHVLPVNPTKNSLGAGWDFNGNEQSPTFSPSVLGKWDEWQGEGVPPKPYVCHLFVRDGMLQYLNDCTHHLAGQTVPMVPINAEEE